MFIRMRLKSVFRTLVATCAFALLAAGSLAGADESDSAADYLALVKPVLTERCYACHAALKQEAGLRLDTVESLLSGGDSGPAITAGQSSASLLIERIRQSDPNERMPPEGPPLTEEEILSIEGWIASGAAAPDSDKPQSDPRQHWAFVQPDRRDITELQSGGITESQSGVPPLEANPIDLLLGDSQRRQNIDPLPPADARTLIRRLYIDLLGIPPTPEQVAVFVNDRSSHAYEVLVDHLLSQTEYGERWGRHWMDVWRYSDWYGRRTVPDVMNSYPQIWRWRDWIVRSLNEDKGYDQMIMEMLAADEFCPDNDENIVATGFLVRNWYKWNYESWMKDNVEHTGKAFLGLTFNCAHCHDHKYDPIRHEDYFRFRAFFEPLELRQDRVVGQSDPGPFKKYVYAESYGPISTGSVRVFDEKLDAKTFMYLGGDARNRVETQEDFTPGPPIAFLEDGFSVEPVTLPAEAYYPGLKSFVREEELSIAVEQLETARKTFEAANATQASASDENGSAEGLSPVLTRMDRQIAHSGVLIAEARLHSLQCRIAADDAHYRGMGDAALLSKLAHQAERRLEYETAHQALFTAERAAIAAEQQVGQSSGDQLEAARQELTKQLSLVKTAREAVDSARSGLASNEATYTPLSPVYPTKSTGRRLALARWITHRQNPLTARVAVNHIWMRHFGNALVETAENFGIQGKSPRHPELLDWLAVELMDNHWSMKHIHRLIVTSQTYRRSSSPPMDHTGLQIDPDNETYWRYLPRRMEAEVVRDSVLACSGALDHRMGGPDIDPTDWVVVPRRSLYFTIHGESKMQFVDTFDGPNVCDCYRRTSTVLPQQALAMTNSELLVHCGRRLAERVVQQSRIPVSHELDPPDTTQSLSNAITDDHFVQIAFELILNRPPKEAELDASLRFLIQQRELLQAVPPEQLAAEGNSNVQPASTEIQRRAWENLAISLFSHNDFVTVR